MARRRRPVIAGSVKSLSEWTHDQPHLLDPLLGREVFHVANRRRLEQTLLTNPMLCYECVLTQVASASSNLQVRQHAHNESWDRATFAQR